MNSRVSRFSRFRKHGSTTAVLVAAALLAGATPSSAEEYHSDRAGHPLRVIAYVLHPIGVIFDTLIFRPFHWNGSHQPFKTLHGQKE